MIEPPTALLSEIELAFSVSQPPPGSLIECGCEECEELQRDFSGRCWRDVPDEVIQYHQGDLPLFSDAAWRYYLPAYLRLVLRGRDKAGVRDFVFYSLSPEYLTAEQAQAFSPTEVKVLRSYLQWELDSASGCERGKCAKVLEFWNRLGNDAS